jgi:hypothetical protein
MSTDDPIERIVSDALCSAGYAFESPAFLDEGRTSLDFKVGDVFIECKAYHSDRISKQMARAENVIAIQGRAAAEWFSEAIAAAIREKAKE